MTDDLLRRAALLDRIASGEVSLADALDVDPADTSALASLGAAALQSGRHELAERVFGGLAALEPGAPLHQLHLACARAARGDAPGALAAIDAFFSSRGERSVEDEIEALLLRAELTGRTRPDVALEALGRARALQRGAR